MNQVHLERLTCRTSPSFVKLCSWPFINLYSLQFNTGHLQPMLDQTFDQSFDMESPTGDPTHRFPAKFEYGKFTYIDSSRQR